MVPDLDYLPVLEPEDVDARELDAFAGRIDRSPATSVGAGSGPPRCHKIAVGDEQIRNELKVRERSTEVRCDLCLSGAARYRFSCSVTFPVSLRRAVVRDLEVIVPVHVVVR